MKNIILILSLLFNISYSFGQIIIDTANCEYRIDGLHDILTTNMYTIKNTSSQPYYLWLTNDSCSNQDTIALFKRYFLRIDVDFSLSALCFDGNIEYHNPYIPILYVTFLKKINPGEDFFIISPSRDPVGFNMFLLPELEVQTVINTELLDSFLYTCPFIYLGMDDL